MGLYHQFLRALIVNANTERWGLIACVPALLQDQTYPIGMGDLTFERLGDSHTQLLTAVVASKRSKAAVMEPR